MVAFLYDFNGPDTPAGEPIPVPDGHPALEQVSGAWRRLSNRAYTVTARDEDPILAVTLGSGDVDISADVGNGGDAIYVRVLDGVNWVRARTRRRSTTRTQYEWVAGYRHPTAAEESCLNSYPAVPSSTAHYAWNTSSTIPPFFASTRRVSHAHSVSGNFVDRTASYRRTGTPSSTGDTRRSTSTTYTVHLEKCVNGTVTSLGEYDGSATRLRVRAVGTSVQVFVNDSDTAAISANVADHVDVARHGIGRGDSEVNSTALDNLTVDALNTAPQAPTLLSPTDTPIARTLPQRFLWQFNDPDAGDTQSAYRLRYRPTGQAVDWTDLGWRTATSSHHDFPGGTFAEGDYEWQVATRDAAGEAGPFSISGFFAATTPPPGPSITSPANGATIPTSTYPLTWSAPSQGAYQVQVLDGDTVIVDTGTVESANTRTHALDFPDNDVERALRVRVLDDGLWSSWSTVTVTVSYAPPAVPVVGVDDVTTDGAIRVQAQHPEPDETQPVVESVDVWRRRTDDHGPGIRRATNLPPTGVFTDWFVASGVDYAYRVRAYGTNGTSVWSEWSADPAPVYAELDGGSPSATGDEVFDGGTV